MHHIVTKRGLLGGALMLAFSVGWSATTQAQTSNVTAGDLIISQARTRATPSGAKVGGGYLTIENKGTVADKLVGGSTDVAGKLEVHQMSMNNGVMKMHPVEGGLTIEPGKTVKLEPGGYHLMMMELKQPFKQGGKVPVTLEFAKAGKVTLSLDVQGIGAQAPHAGGSMMMKKNSDSSHSGGGK